MFSAGSQGFVDQQSPENQHKKFVDEFTDDNLTKKAEVSGDSGIIESTFSPILAISDLINSIIGILVSPYSTVSGTALPSTLKLLVQALIGLSEMYVGYLFVRGGA